MEPLFGVGVRWAPPKPCLIAKLRFDGTAPPTQIKLLARNLRNQKTRLLVVPMFCCKRVDKDDDGGFDSQLCGGGYRVCEALNTLLGMET